MQWSISFVVDLAKVAFIVGALAFGFYWVDHQVAKISPIPPSPVKPKEEGKERRRILPLRAELPEPADLAELPDDELMGKITLGDTNPPDGSEIQIDYPLSQDKRNIGSRVDGQGMCVTTASEMSAIWCGLDQLRGFRDYCAGEPGGCDPQKFDRQLAAFCKRKGIEVPDYLQYQGKDPDFLRMVLRTGRMPAVTYSGRDGVQYRGPIAHVNNPIHFANGIAGVLDNNYDPAKRIWMSEAEYLDRAAFGRRRNYWAIVWLAAGPPPAVKK